MLTTARWRHYHRYLPSGSAVDIARHYFPDADERLLEAIIWGGTGYPSFWHIPKDGATPELCFRHQLKYSREHLLRGGSLDDFWDQNPEVNPLLEIGIMVRAPCCIQVAQ